MPHSESRNLRHGGYGAFFRCRAVHLVSADIRHTIGGIVYRIRFRVVPAVPLDKAHAVGSTPAQIVTADVLLIDAHIVRILCCLCRQRVPCQHLSKGSPHIPPARCFRRNCPLHQIQIILGGGIDIVGGVHILRAHIAHQLCKILGNNTGSEGIVDGGDQLVIRLLRLKAADQPRHKSRLVGMVI